jgi:hypothetical protein
MESFDLLINPDLINSIKKFLKENILIKEEKISSQKNSISMNFSSSSRSISQSKPIKYQKSSSTKSKKISPSNSFSFFHLNKIFFFRFICFKRFN